tara:strand:+ start:38 stop:1240 length:1203 start_codon:yes stop_codon:yes gene_type:complete
MNFNIQAAFSFSSTTTSIFQSSNNNSLNSHGHGRHGGHHEHVHHRHGNKQSAPATETPVSPQTPNSAPAQTQAAQTDTPDGVVVGERQSAESTAENILSHVQKGLDALKESGASQEQIDARLEAAKEGIATGYAQAREMLEGMGMMDDALAADIDRGETLVNEGISSMAAGDIPALLASDEADTVSNTDAADTEVPTSSINTPTYSAAAMRTSNNMSLEVITQDGDRVTVDFSQRQGSLEMRAGGLSVSASAFSEKWDMEVRGNLDDGEVAALEELFADVQKLSETFFGGDLGAALEEAMSLGFDGNELASMSLNLRQQSFSNVSRAYGQAGPSMPTERLESQRSNIADYVDSYMKAIDKASPSLSNPLSNLQDMLAQLVPEDDRLGALASFNEGLNRLL